MLTIEELHIGWATLGTSVHIIPPPDWAPPRGGRQSLNAAHNDWVRETHPRHTMPMCGTSATPRWHMPLTQYQDGDLTPFLAEQEREWCGPCVGRLMAELGLADEAMDLTRGQRRLLTPRS